MSRTDDRRDITLPVTNEVGSEGGSYADPTQQVETFEKPEKDAREAGNGGVGSAANYAIHREDLTESPAEPAGTRSGMRRYPTEPPDSESSSARSARAWSPGLVGAAAGLAIGIIAGRRR